MTHDPAEYYVIHDGHSWYMSMTEYLERIETNGVLTPYWGGGGLNKIRDRIVMLSDRVYAIEALTANLMIGSTKEATWFGIRANARASYLMMKSMVADAKANLEQMFQCSVGFDLERNVSSYSLLYLVVEFATDTDALLFKLGPLSDFQSTYPDMVVMDVRAEVQLEMPPRSPVMKVMTR